MGKRDLPDIYARALGSHLPNIYAQAQGPQAQGRGHIYQANLRALFHV